LCEKGGKKGNKKGKYEYLERSGRPRGAQSGAKKKKRCLKKRLDLGKGVSPKWKTSVVGGLASTAEKKDRKKVSERGAKDSGDDGVFDPILDKTGQSGEVVVRGYQSAGFPLKRKSSTIKKIYTIESSPK